MTVKHLIICLAGLIGGALSASAQDSATIRGLVVDKKDRPISEFHVLVIEHPHIEDFTNKSGVFTLRVPVSDSLTLALTALGFETVYERLGLAPNEIRDVRIVVARRAFEVDQIVIESDPDRGRPSVQVLDPKEIEYIPLPSGNFENLLKTVFTSVGTAGGELSTQYSVRGGNFDENLIYVNGFEIYRPLLIRSGQQEGLSFLNRSLIRNVKFSAGGFEAQYGDKMSSVLDVQYKRPDSLAGSVELSMLGINAHLEGASRNKRVMYLAGFRQKSNQYLLNSLNVKGQYRPSFTDFQALGIYRINERWELEAIGNIARNRFQFVPVSRVTSIGTVNDVKQLEVFFEGQEIDAFETYMGGLSSTYTSDSSRFQLKFFGSAYRSLETETFDILGDYFLYQVESNFGDEDFGERLFALGYGTFQDFARNDLVATVANVGHTGYRSGKRHFLEWGWRAQYENIVDKLNEWERLDSAFYSLPFSNSEVLVREVLKARLEAESQRFDGFIQDSWIVANDSNKTINISGGIRGQYWTLNKEFLLSPRAQISFKPNWERDVLFKGAVGLYQQAPFYREMRNFEGQLNTSLSAQKSLHVVLGSDYLFELWDRPFRLISEVYYKQMWDLVPFEVEDVKIRYFGENLARGYTTGLDLRLNGEFVANAESWITMSIFTSREDIEGDHYFDYFDSTGTQVYRGTLAFQGRSDSVRNEIGYLPRPTDQRFKLGMAFQDYLPSNKNFKMHLNLLFGTGLPFGPPRAVRFRNALRIPPYRRVDIGFSALLIDGNKPHSNWKRHMRSLWASIEIFNLLGVRNTISHIWVKDNFNTEYAFENHLTSRLLNVRLIGKF